jgi:hypothetical protein
LRTAADSQFKDRDCRADRSALRRRVSKSLDERVLGEKPPYLGPAHSLPFSMDQTHFPETLSARLFEVLGKHARQVARQERMEIERIFDRNSLHHDGQFSSLDSQFSIPNSQFLADFRQRPCIAALAIVLSALACVSSPRPTAAADALKSNARANVEGRVVDIEGRPVAGLSVEAIPRGKDILWAPPATTDSAGRFALELFAPAEYGFVLHEGDTAVVTDDPRDPSKVHVAVRPGERRSGVQLLFLREERQAIEKKGS